jgi:hypothetical protein
MKCIIPSIHIFAKDVPESLPHSFYPPFTSLSNSEKSELVVAWEDGPSWPAAGTLATHGSIERSTKQGQLVTYQRRWILRENGSFW